MNELEMMLENRNKVWKQWVKTVADGEARSEKLKNITYTLAKMLHYIEKQAKPLGYKVGYIREDINEGNMYLEKVS